MVEKNRLDLHFEMDIAILSWNFGEICYLNYWTSYRWTLSSRLGFYLDLMKNSIHKLCRLKKLFQVIRLDVDYMNTRAWKTHVETNWPGNIHQHKWFKIKHLTGEKFSLLRDKFQAFFNGDFCYTRLVISMGWNI